MADEATPQETTTENTPVETVETPVETLDTPVSGGDDRATDTETPAEDTDTKPTADPEIARLNKEVDRLRKEAAANRVKGNEKAEKAAQEAAKKASEELVSKLGKVLGYVPDETEPDPAELLKHAQEREAQLAAERDSANERLRNYARKDALSAAAVKVDGDLASLLDSRTVNAAIEKLDTDADDFTSQVEAIVSDAVESNPKLKKAVQVAAPSSGGDLSGGNAAPKTRGPNSVEDFRREIAEKAKRKL